MKHFEFELKTTDGLQLRGQGWDPSGRTEAVACLVHGLGEHSDRYTHLSDAFVRAHFALNAIDLRGHGHSPGRRGHAPGYHALMSDINAFLHATEDRYPDVPCFLYGHSLGGNLVIHYALKRKPDIAGVIASAPLFRTAFKPPAWKTALLNSLHTLRVNIAISTGLDETALSTDSEVVRRYHDDPFVHGRITPALAVPMLREGEWNLQHAADFPLPLLLMHGEADRITSVEASVEFASQVEHRCTLKIWDGCYHELHNEPIKDQVFAYVQEWMKQQL